ncbi:SgcJ/EcaC family oxidoreductase [Herbidospora mongoliensis]|uniref:SgcJ/EcaC family oxidoreductase n=1 Tax=Herbidospora mongoliensis TaxID=688067 RepID=UPI00082ACB64|nr:SgcJ/EcaC family oxidoreductase [Herbidospora mongoliensis]
MDIEEITRIVTTVEHAQRDEQVEEFVALFRHDAIWTTGHGRRLFGRDEIADFTRKVLPGGMTGLSMTFEIEHILFIRPDVAAVKLVQQYRTLEGEPEGNPGSPMWVMAKEDGRWLLTACQNTEVR